MNPVYRRIEKVVNRAIAVDYFFYLAVAVAGYAASFSDTATIVLERKTLDGKPDYPCLIAIFGVMLSMVVAFPCGYNPARAEMSMLFLGKEEFSTKANVVMTVSWMALSWIISVLFPKIDKVI